MEEASDEQTFLKEELLFAQTQVEVGATYQHYKTAKNIYRVVTLAIQEEDSQLCVVYQAEYGSRITYTRSLLSWLQPIDQEGEQVLRFTKVDTETPHSLPD